MLTLWILLQDTPIENVERIFGYMLAFLDALGIRNWVIGAFMAWIILGITMRVLEAIGGSRAS